MEINERGKSAPELSDEALGAVTGGAGSPSLRPPKILSEGELRDLLGGQQGHCAPAKGNFE